MPGFAPDLPAEQVHARFTATLREAEAVRKNLVLWFADIHRRKLYLELGYTSIYAYAVEAHGFSKTRCAQFVRIAESLEELPVLRRSLAAGGVPWTRAREVVKVATPETDRAWVEEARRSSRRELERKVAAAQGRTKAACGAARDQAVLALGPAPSRAGAGAARSAADLAAGVSGTSVASGSHHSGDAGALGPDAGPGFGSGAAFPGSGGSDDQRAQGCRRPEEGGPAGLPAAAAGVHLRFPPVLYARYGAAIEALRKQGWRGPVEELLVMALDHLIRAAGPGTMVTAANDDAPTAVELNVVRAPAGIGRMAHPGPDARVRQDGAASEERIGKKFTRVNSDPERSGSVGRPRASGQARPAPLQPVYQVVVHQCEDCGRGSVATGRGPKPLDPAELRAVLCDARIHRSGERNRSAIPPSLRREVLERDGYRCRVAGCGSPRFLSVHHRKPRSAGGRNTLENLITACASCHRAIHAMAERSPGFAVPVAKPPEGSRERNRKTPPPG